MTNDKPMAAAGEASVGDQCHLAPEAATADGAGGAQHLAHARTALGPLVAYDDHVPGPHPAGENRCRRALLAVEYAGASPKVLAFLAADLGHRALRSEIAVEHHQVAVLFQWARKRPHNVLIRPVLGRLFEILTQALARHGEALPVQQPRIEQHLHERL